MVEPVAADRVSGAHQGGDHPQVGHVAGAEDGRSLGPFEGCQPRFHRLVQRQMADHQPGSAGPGAPAGRGGLGRLNEPGVLGQPQVIVGGEIEQDLPLQAHPAAGEDLLQHLQTPPQGLGLQGGQFLGQLF